MWKMVIFTVLIFFSACHYSERPVAMFKEAYKINAPFTVYIKTVLAGRVYVINQTVLLTNQTITECSTLL